MKFNETKKIGLDIFFINIILLLFIYSKDGLTTYNLILAVASSSIASGLNLYYIIKGSKTKINKIFFVINSLIVLAITILLIKHII